jgi:hypothetical protein
MRGNLWYEIEIWFYDRQHKILDAIFYRKKDFEYQWQNQTKAKPYDNINLDSFCR